MAGAIEQRNAGAQVFTKIYFASALTGIVPVGALIVLGALFASPAMPWPWVTHLLMGGGSIAGAVLLAALVALPGILRNRDHITVTRDAITFQAWGDGSRVTLPRDEGGLLLVLPGFSDRGRYVSRHVTQLGTGRKIGVSWFFPKRALWRACERAGWRFGYSPELAERHLRRWQTWDWHASASNLIRVYGPFTMPAVPGGHLSLGAAILEEYGDEIIEAARKAAGSYPATRLKRDAARAYRRAASEQRFYEALAGSASERTTRTAEADRLEAKAAIT